MRQRGLIALAVCVLAAGCNPHDKTIENLRQDNPRLQMAAIAKVAREEDLALAGELVRLLEAEDEAVRFMAAAALHRLTGKNRGFHFASAERRKEIVAQWHRWWEAESGEPVPELPKPEPAEDENESPRQEETASPAESQPEPEGESARADRHTEAHPPEGSPGPADGGSQDDRPGTPGSPTEYQLPPARPPQGETPSDAAKENAG